MFKGRSLGQLRCQQIENRPSISLAITKKQVTMWKFMSNRYQHPIGNKHFEFHRAESNHATHCMDSWIDEIIGNVQAHRDFYNSCNQLLFVVYKTQNKLVKKARELVVIFCFERRLLLSLNAINQNFSSEITSCKCSQATSWKVCWAKLNDYIIDIHMHMNEMRISHLDFKLCYENRDTSHIQINMAEQSGEMELKTLIGILSRTQYLNRYFNDCQSLIDVTDEIHWP